jgi:hypothetical protein
MDSYGASSMSGAVEPCVVRGQYTGKVCGFIQYVIRDSGLGALL